ncbi:MAG: phosphatidylglycerophosphatase A [Holophagales bacterium]|nr:phosphatidylglycerophosphatase A [Holophagales bacterium]
MPEYEKKDAPAWAWWAATGLWSGKLNPAPGTWGSLAGWGAWFVVIYIIRFLPAIAFECILAAATLLLVFVSVKASGMVARQVGESDPSYIVCDEWAGMWIALWPTRHEAELAMDSGGWKLAFSGMLVAFLLFRVFDIWKPWPICKLEALPGGWGITLDDVAAGVYAAIVLTVANMAIWL